MGKPKSDEAKNNARKKTRKSKDLSKCCATCAFFDNRKTSDTTCSLTGESVDRNDVCKRCDTSVTEKCQRCGKPIRYFSKEEYYNAINHFHMTNNGGSTGQNMHLCKECSFQAWLLYQDFLTAIRENKNPSWEHSIEDFKNDFTKKEN